MASWVSGSMFMINKQLYLPTVLLAFSISFWWNLFMCLSRIYSNLNSFEQKWHFDSERGLAPGFSNFIVLPYLYFLFITIPPFSGFLAYTPWANRDNFLTWMLYFHYLSKVLPQYLSFPLASYPITFLQTKLCCSSRFLGSDSVHEWFLFLCRCPIKLVFYLNSRIHMRFLPFSS